MFLGNVVPERFLQRKKSLKVGRMIILCPHNIICGMDIVATTMLEIIPKEHESNAEAEDDDPH